MAASWPETRATLLGKLRDPERREEAWRDFYNLYRPSVFGLCRSLGMSEHDAEDQTQDCVIKAGREVTEGRFEYDPSRSFRAWLATIVRNSIRTWQQSFAQRLRGSGNDEVQLLLESLPDQLECLADELADSWAQWEAIEQVRRDVPVAEWEVYILFESGQFSAVEAAPKLGKTVGAFWAFASRLRRRIRERREDLESGK